ncbi:hypothetical protein CIT37_29145 [Bradyrhizobium ottawaense]|uniref:Chitin-binding type-3 domain-containing protein n=1 Tax=Bradyrhizobium ottawaense TaxID=931866 RepID=A0A2U8PDA1_9BRAD|nr:hypothetical protein [Bradyrhizobium ottawaense]AWL95753.1 hypothetical protein CIT37_29145 [Bradyrhizobium ottawaense]
MTALSSYSTGTVSVSAGGTTATGSGTIWNDGSVKPGDILQIGNFQSVITDVTDATHLVIPPWGGGAVSGAAYKIWQVSPQRFAGSEAMSTVGKLVTALNAREIPVVVGDDETVPDPSLGEEDQTAIQPSTGKVWVMSGGVWTFLGIYKGFNFTGAYDNATVYSYGDVMTDAGSSYIWINATPGSGQAAPNTTYWQLLASKGDTGTTGSTGATGAAGAGATGQCKLVKSGSNVVLQQFNGKAIRINGQVCSVPNAGVSLAPTGLTPGTTYFIYATQSGGVVNALEASTTAHATSTTSGNEGTEIKSGDDARSLVGQVRVITGPAFADTASQRFVASWFNRGRRDVTGAVDGVSTDTGTSNYTEKAVSKAEFVAWADEVVDAKITGTLTNYTSTGACGFAMFFDGVVGDNWDVNPTGATLRIPASGMMNQKAGADGYHYVSFGLRAIGGGTASAVYGLRALATVG